MLQFKFKHPGDKAPGVLEVPTCESVGRCRAATLWSTAADREHGSLTGTPGGGEGCKLSAGARGDDECDVPTRQILVEGRGRIEHGVHVQYGLLIEFPVQE